MPLTNAFEISCGVDRKTEKNRELIGKLLKNRWGLGLISILEHTISMAAKMMLWIIQDGNQTLQHFLREKTGSLFVRRWGNNDFLWVIFPGRTLLVEVNSNLWLNLCTL